MEIKPTPISGTKLTGIGEFKTTDKDQPYLEVYVYYEHLDKPVQPADWVKENIKSFGHEIINEKEITSDGGNKYVDILTRDGSIITRTTELVNDKGDYIMLSVFCDEKDYENLANTIQYISSQWRLK